MTIISVISRHVQQRRIAPCPRPCDYGRKTGGLRDPPLVEVIPATVQVFAFWQSKLSLANQAWPRLRRILPPRRWFHEGPPECARAPRRREPPRAVGRA